jgi:hypothetical protein
LVLTCIIGSSKQLADEENFSRHSKKKYEALPDQIHIAKIHPVKKSGSSTKARSGSPLRHRAATSSITKPLKPNPSSSAKRMFPEDNASTPSHLISFLKPVKPPHTNKSGTLNN